MLAVIVTGTCQMFILAIGTNILLKKVLSKIEVLIVGTILAIGGLILLATVQYFALIYAIGVLVAVLRFKKASWFMAIVAPITSLLIMIVSDYTIIWSTIMLQVEYQDLLMNTPFVYSAFQSAIMLLYIFIAAQFFTRLKSNYLVLILLVVTIVIIYIFIYIGSLYEFPTDILTIFTILFTTFSVLTGIVFVVVTKIIQSHIENQEREVELNHLKDYTSRLEHIYIEMSLFKHDYINILVSLQGYISSGNQQELETYFKKTIVPLNKKILIKNDR
ncbi:accessory gene regulator protein C [Listeria grandensis FSL F6-0971]|uniref:Accessory gene regulator protein C n=1 Tax=Listeria grandensis FSL F6-0971 TaxID=1265819 RepID=W7BQR7_9LIST|nr:hypothetical protein [Listeria grandensis]EUJ22553.1 accessory gene regulator protein C [Listeria grandensis FSL F6-0971]